MLTRYGLRCCLYVFILNLAFSFDTSILIFVANIVIGPTSLIGRILSLTSGGQTGRGNKLIRCPPSPLQVYF